MKATLTFFSIMLTISSYAQMGGKIEHPEGGDFGYLFNFEHTEVSNLLCDGLFNIYNRQGTVVTLEEHALSLYFEKNSILNPSVANKFIGSTCGVLYKDIDISKNPIIEIEVSSSEDCQVGFLVAANVKEQFTYADGLGYKLQKLTGGQKTVLRFSIPETSWRGKVIDFKRIIGWGVQVKGPKGEPLPTLGQGRKINVFAISFGESLTTAKLTVPKVATPSIVKEKATRKKVIAATPSIEETKKTIATKLKAPQEEGVTQKTLNYQDAQFTQNYQTAVNISMNDTTRHIVTTFIKPGTKTLQLDTKSKESISVYNTYGEAKEVFIIDNILELEGLPNGTYIVKQGKLTTRFVKQ